MNFISIKTALGIGYQKEPHELEIAINFDLVTIIEKDEYGKAILRINSQVIETREDYDDLITKVTSIK